MRALLVVNPRATSSSSATRDVIARALGSVAKLDVVETTHARHAVELAQQAAADRLDAVLVLGGDGTVNEVVNGLLTDDVDPQLPALGVVPGGLASVFAQALGMPRDPVEAASALIEGIRAGRRVPLGLGRIDDHWFTFNAGMGYDARVVRAVQHHRGRGPASVPLFVREAVREFYARADRRAPAITIELPGQEPVGPMALAIVANTDPWTFIGDIPLRLTPQAAFDTGLDVLALRRLRAVGTLRVAGSVVGHRGRPATTRDVWTAHDLPGLRLVSDRPMAVQADGEDLGDRSEVTLTSVPAALQVIAP